MTQTPAEERRAVALQALTDTLRARGIELPAGVAQEAAGAVLAAIHPLAEHCTHYVTAHRQHHDQPVTGCPWCAETPGAPA